MELLAQRLSQRSSLMEDDVAAIRELPFETRHIRANSYLLREGEPPRAWCSLILSGVAFRHKLTAEGARQIVSIHMRSDILDLQHLFLNVADHSVQALTELSVADIARSALQRIALDRPAVGRAF